MGVWSLLAARFKPTSFRTWALTPRLLSPTAGRKNHLPPHHPPLFHKFTLLYLFSPKDNHLFENTVTFQASRLQGVCGVVLCWRG